MKSLCNRKLVLNQKTIAYLSAPELKDAKGGYHPNPYTPNTALIGEYCPGQTSPSLCCI